MALLSAFSVPSSAFDLVAHRGIHQNYSREDLDNETCTASRMESPSHDFLENTLPSIQRAFDLGADIVEIDIHPTTEAKPEENRLVVFHDWTLDCRTEARCESGCQCKENSCVTDQQSWGYMRGLDLGHGYTADGGKTFPFRGKGIGQMPTFLEAVNLLERNPGKRLLVNVKDKYERTQRLLLKELATVPKEIRERVLVEFWPQLAPDFRALGVPEAIWQGHGLKACLSKYIFIGWMGLVPEECESKKFFVPLHQDLSIVHPRLKGIQVTSMIWGWPDSFIERMKRNGTQVYLSAVESAEDLSFARAHGFAGIMTNKIEVIGPLVRK